VDRAGVEAETIRVHVDRADLAKDVGDLLRVGRSVAEQVQVAGGSARFFCPELEEHGPLQHEPLTVR
jgi:hypothetical protein